MGFQCQGNSIWPICIPSSLFCYEILPTFPLSYWDANSYYPRGLIIGKENSLNFKIGWDCGFLVPGPFNLAHLHSFKLLLFLIFFQLFPLSYWEANSYYPRGLIMGKGNSLNFKIGWVRRLSVPSPFNLGHLHSFKMLLSWKFSSFITIIQGGQFLLPQKANNGKREFTKLCMRLWVFSARAIQSGPFTSLWAFFSFEFFSIFPLSYW